MKRRWIVSVFVFAAALGGLLSRRGTARAQIDPQRQSLALYEARQGAMPVLVGEVYREGADPSRYTEHWVLYPNYVYPSERTDHAVSLQVGHAEYRDAADFLGRVSFERGSRYVRVACVDSAERPSLP